ncbi:MAG: S8 family serine peptidase [Thermoplasmatota archaeon]
MTGTTRGIIRPIICLAVMILLVPSFAAAAETRSGELPSESVSWWNADPADLIFTDTRQGEFDPYVVVLGPLAFDPVRWEDVAEVLPHASNGDRWLVQFRSPDDLDMLRTLEHRGFRLIEPVSLLTFLVEAADQDSGYDLKGEPWVRTVIPYHPAMKISPPLYQLANARDGDGSEVLMIGLYDINAGTDVRRIAERCGDRPIIHTSDGTITGFLPLRDILDIASMPGVSYISLRSYEDQDNDIAADIIDVKEVWDTMGLNGSGQIVAVADSGLDTGNNATIHQDVKGRILSAYAYARTGNWSDPDIHVWTSSGWSYKGGHGTHVVGSVLGDGAASNGNHSGMAPEAELVMQSTMASSGSYSIPEYNRLFDDAYNSGARIHTNSWSSRSSYGNYTGKSWLIDNYMWRHKNLTTLFSAGNNGDSGPYYVSTQASSKNVIAVGASESYRPSISSWANNISEIAVFSSQGYTWGDNRIKPDVVAPGTYILSMRNSQLTDFWNHYWGSNSTYVGVNNKYAYYGGTSMSTPIVAGMTALIRQYYTDLEDHDDPSSALIKATVINGARPLNGKWDSVPNRYEGWGRVNLSNSLGSKDSDAGNMKYIDSSTGIKNGETSSNIISVSSGSSDLIITLVWTDYPGSNTSSVKLVNDLDLTLKTPDGKEYYGNDLTSPFNKTRDRVNNVERIRVPSPAPGLYTLNITGYSVSYGPQPYAVVMTGRITKSVGKIEWSREIVNADGGSVELSLSDSNLTGAGYHLIKVNTTTDPAGEMINLTEMIQDGSYTGIFTGVIKITMGQPGSGEVRSTVDGELRAYYIESYPKRTLISSTMVLIPPIILDVTHDADGMNLTYQDPVIMLLNGTPGYSARFSVENITGLESIPANDEGVTPDARSGDGIYTGSFIVPNYVNGTFNLTGYLKRPELPEVGRNSSVSLIINTNIPRMPVNISVDPLPMGNILKVTWEDPGDPNLMNFKIFRANETYPGSGDPADFTQVHQTPDSRTYYTDRDLIDGARYFYSLTSFNVLGFDSRRTEPVSGVPSDTASPWIEIVSPESDTTVRGEVEITLNYENDAEWISIQAAVDNDDDGSPDNGWIEIVNMTDPRDTVEWNTKDLPAGLSEGDLLVLRARGADEAGNMNSSDTVPGISIDNTMPGILDIASPLVQSLPDASYSLVGTSEPNSRITVSRNGVPTWMYLCDETGLFQFHLSLEYGVNLFEVASYDSIGNGPLIHDEILYIVYDPDDPVAVIPDLDLATSKPVVLDGSQSYDEGPESDLSGIKHYFWTVEFDGETSNYEGSEVSFDIPRPGMITIELTVRDHAGNTGTVSVQENIADDIPPVLGGMSDLEVDEDGNFVLIPPDVSDNDPDIIETGVFFWNITGPEAFSVYGRSPTFKLSTPGIYSGYLMVFDTGGNTDRRDFKITVRDITPPSARAGPDLVVIKYDTVVLDGSSSIDNDPMFPSGYNFTWRIHGLGLILYGVSVSFVPDEIGVYDIELTVADRGDNTDNDEMNMRVVSDGSPPRLVRSVPGNGWKNATPDTDILLIFSEVLDESTVEGGIRLIGSIGGDVDAEISVLDGMMVIVKPESGLTPGGIYTISIGSSLLDRTGTQFEAMTISFTVRPEIRFEFAGTGGIPGDEVHVTALPGEVTVTFDNPISEESAVTVRDSEGREIEVEYIISSDGDLVIIFPVGTRDGVYTIDLSGVLGRDGGPLVDKTSITVTVSADQGGDPGPGGGGPGGMIAIIVAAAVLVLFILSAAAAFLIARSRRGDGQVEPDSGYDNGAGDPYHQAAGHRDTNDISPGKQ